MTTIAWDGKTMAADTMAVGSYKSYPGGKIKKIGGYLVGSSGPIDCIEIFLRAFSGVDTHNPPDVDLSRCEPQDDPHFLVVSENGVWQYWKTGVPVPVRNEALIAIGSGRDFAMAAMFSGLDAQDAVGIAIKLDASTGGVVDTATLTDD
jgi:hypothetical protein